MENTDSTEVKYKIRSWSLPGASIVPVLNVSSESFGWNWMIKLSWTAMRGYRKISCVMCFRRSVLLRGRALEEKDLQLGLCCQTVKMRMTDSTSCYRRRTYLYNSEYCHRGSQNRSSAKSGAGCRPSICGWWSSYGGECLLT